MRPTSIKLEPHTLLIKLSLKIDVFKRDPTTVCAKTLRRKLKIFVSYYFSPTVRNSRIFPWWIMRGEKKYRVQWQNASKRCKTMIDPVKRRGNEIDGWPFVQEMRLVESLSAGSNGARLLRWKITIARVPVKESHFCRILICRKGLCTRLSNIFCALIEAYWNVESVDDEDEKESGSNVREMSFASYLSTDYSFKTGIRNDRVRLRLLYDTLASCKCMKRKEKKG